MWGIVVEGVNESCADSFFRFFSSFSTTGIVTTTLQHVAPTLLSKVKSRGGWPDTFFELWRWDFVVSKDGQVKIMEVNMR